MSHTSAPAGGHSKAYASSNPAFLKAGLAGVEANHSSTTPSTQNDIGAHAQSDDELQDVPPPQDPNLSGRTPTEDTYTWLAGPISAWQENDDYRDFLEGEQVAESVTSHRYRSVHDGDYDDNSGHAIALGHGKGVHGSIPVESDDRDTAHDFPIGLIVRRI